MSGIFWIPLALISFFTAALKPVNARGYLCTLLSAFMVITFGIIIDKDTKSISQLFSFAFVFMAGLYTFNIAGLISLVRFFRLRSIWAYIALLAASVVIYTGLNYAGYLHYNTTGSLVWHTAFFFTMLSLAYFLSGRLSRFINRKYPQNTTIAVN